MSGTRCERWSRARWILVLALVPGLLLGAAFDGAVAWIHSHGLRGGHLHLLAGEHEVSALDEWHAADHRHAHAQEPEHQDEERDDHGGVVVELPEFVAVSTRGAQVLLPSSVLAQAPIFQRWAVTRGEVSRPPEWARSGWPPQPDHRSGIAALLRSSHAILI